MCLMKPRKMFQVMNRKYLPFKILSPPEVIARLPIMFNNVSCFYPLSFQRKKCLWKADIRVESNASSLNTWLESVP